MPTESHRLALPVGSQIEHFCIEGVLGKGGFGITYLAADARLGKRVAIKELLPDTIATRAERNSVVPHSSGMQQDWEWARERFLEEARALAAFSHPAIVGVHRLIEANGTVYMVMDYVEGESYEARLQRIGTEPDQASLMAVVSPILSGLDEVHAHGLLHRDIKPENILIDKRGQPVLIDFGSARESVGKTMTMTSIVTHGYSPIEQYQTKGRMGPWTDIYAIAAVMCRAITGEKPPVASDRIVQDDFEWLNQRAVPSFTASFRKAIDVALCVRGEDRPPSIGAWRHQLFSTEASSPPHGQVPPKRSGDSNDTSAAPRATSRGVSSDQSGHFADDAPADGRITDGLRGKRPIPLAFLTGAATIFLLLFALSLLTGPKRKASEPRVAEAAPHTTSHSPDDFELVEVAPPQTPESEGTWKITSLQGRDYLPLSEVAAFYKLNMEVNGDTATLKSASRRLAFKANSRFSWIDFVKQWLSFPVLYSDGSFYVSRMDLSKAIDPLMRPHQISGLQPVTTVVLDPAHGGDDSGAVNRYGSEKNYTLDVTRRIRACLQKAGLKVVITRNGDNLESAEARAAVATQLNQEESGSIFVSLHFNASPKKDPPDTGFEIFTLTPKGAPNTGEDFFTQDSFSAEPGHRYDHASTALASAIYHAMLGRVPMFDNGAKRARTTELRLARAPAVSIQGGFISHAHDARLLHTVEWRERLAESIALGILEFCSLAATRERPKLLVHYRHEAANAATNSSDFDRQAMDLRERLLQKNEP